jgi:histone H3/H4
MQFGALFRTAKNMARTKGVPRKLTSTDMVPCKCPKSTDSVQVVPGTDAARDKKKYQNSSDTLIPRASFKRLVKDVMQNISSQEHFRMKESAVDALQCAAESYITSLFGDAQLCALHANRVTVCDTDMKLASRIRGDVK